jgi:uncharacterized protein YaaR (DUF327 family)
VHPEETESQINHRMEKSFWEKLGFQDKKKEERHLKESKDKVDESFKSLKETLSNRYTSTCFILL